VDAFPADRQERAYERVLASLRLRADSVTGQPPSTTPSPEPKPQSMPPAGNVNITIHGDVTGNLVVGNENQVNGSRNGSESKAK